MVKVKCLHEKPVNIPTIGGRVDFKPGEEKEVSEELAKALDGRKGFEVIGLKIVKPKIKESKKESKKVGE